MPFVRQTEGGRRRVAHAVRKIGHAVVAHLAKKIAEGGRKHKRTTHHRRRHVMI